MLAGKAREPQQETIPLAHSQTQRKGRGQGFTSGQVPVLGVQADSPPLPTAMFTIPLSAEVNYRENTSGPELLTFYA